MESIIKMVMSGIIGAIVYFLGGWDLLLQILIVVVCVDYLTGILSAIMNRSLNSSIGFRGIIKKVFIFIMVGLSVMIEQAIQQPGMIHPIVILFYVSNEAISITENIAKSGLYVPDFIKKLLAQLNKQTDNGEGVSSIEKSGVDVNAKQ